MAAFSKISHDVVRLRIAFLKATRLTMLLALPACLGISLCADLIVAILLGPKWAQAAFFLRWLALPVGLTAYFQAIYALAVSIDRFSLVVRLNLIDVLVRLALLVGGFFTLGIGGVLVARALTAMIMFTLSMRTAKIVLKLTIREQLVNIWQSAASCAVMAGAIAGLRQWPAAASLGHVAEFALVVGFGAATYLSTLYILGVRVRSMLTLPTRTSWAK